MMDLTSDHPFWAVKNGILANYPAIEFDQRCDVAVIGAGITGALVTEALTADGHDVVVVDGRDVGRGSTCASTALLQYEIDTHLIDLIRMHGAEKARMAYRACHESIDLLEQRIHTLRIDCDFTRKESVYLASKPKDVAIFKKEREARREIGIEVDFWDEGETRERLGVSRPGALHSVQAAEVDVYRLAHGLLKEAERRGARIFDRTRVRSIGIERDGAILRTDREVLIRAKRVVVATGYETGTLFETSDLVNLNSSFAVATEPLRDDQQWWHRCLLWEAARPYFYLRTDSDGRAILGGEDMPFRNAAARDKLIPAKAAKLMRKFDKLFPESAPEPAFCWAGTFGETKDGLAFIGPFRRHPLCLFALGFGGNGITYSMIAAEILRKELRGARHEYAPAFRFDRDA